jgi:hypothetical protein
MPRLPGLRHLSCPDRTGTGVPSRTAHIFQSSQVVSDFSYRVGDAVHILREAMSPKVFNHFIGDFMGQMRDGSPAQLCFESVLTTYSGYKAILAKVRVVGLSVVACLSHVISTSSLDIMRATFSPASVGQSYSADSTILLSTSHGH